MGGYYTQIKERDARIAELEQQLAALREPVAGLRLTPGQVLDRLNKRHNASPYSIFEMAETFGNNLLAAMEIIAQQREQLASRDAWVRTADRLPEPGRVVPAWHVEDVRFGNFPCFARVNRHGEFEDDRGNLVVATHWLDNVPAPPAADEGGDDERS